MKNKLNQQLITAVKIGSQSHVERLLVEGADPTAPGDDGANACDWAKVSSLPDIHKMLEDSIKSYSQEREKHQKLQKGAAEYVARITKGLR